MDIKVTDNVKTAKNQVIRAGHKLCDSGLIARTWGNVSCRTGHNTFVITASGRNYMTLTEEEIIEVKISDLTWAGHIKPSSEKKVHREIYRLKPEAGFVIHTHQNNASAVSAMGISEIKLDREYPGIGNRVICADYGLPGTKKLCRSTAEAVKASSGKAIIMRHHGAVCYGADYEEAFKMAHGLEKACGRYLESIGVEPWRREAEKYEPENTDTGMLWNTCPLVVKFANEQKILKPYLDDFAQMVGTGLKVVDDDTEQPGKMIKKALEENTPLLVRGKGALCAAKKKSDSEALYMVIEKNCRAFFAAQAGPYAAESIEQGDFNGSSSGHGALAACGSHIAGKPIKHWECVLMRQIYLKKYSKLAR